MRTDLPGRRFWGLAASLPLVIPSFIAALALLGAFAPRGLLQQLLEPLGVEALPEISGYWGALLALTLSTYPYVFLLTAAGLRGADPTAEEAARSLGAGRASGASGAITLPTLRPSLAAGALLVALYVLSDFGAVSLMGYSTLTTGIYVRYESLLALDAAAILALVLVALAGRGRPPCLDAGGSAGRSTGAHPARGRPAELVRLGRWKWPALAFCSAVLGLLLVLPLGVLVWWSARADPIAGRARRRLGGRAQLGIHRRHHGGASAAVVVLPVAVLAWRYPSRVSRALERLALSPSALPGIAVALALVFFGVRAGFLYQSLGLLLFAYLDPLHAVRARVHARLARHRQPPAARRLRARSVGSRCRRLPRSSCRLTRPGLLAGGALVFLSTVKELPATLLLRPTGFETLATEIWRGTSIGAYSAVAPSALLLVAIAAPLVYLLSWRNAWELRGSPD